YIINDPSPNAFATGRDPKHGVVCVTQGLLDKLEKSELEGVIAHELSHIGNRDILLGSVIVVLVGLIALLSDLAIRSLFFNRGRRDDKGNLGMIMLFIGIIAAILAPLAASLLRLAISRKREFLADASGALLTRYPEGLARALEKISQDPISLKAASNATNHLFIASPLKGKKVSKLWMTHPPIEERVKALRQMDI
ncbi:MAG: M48 family metallopeptidase, partial [Candidatus Paceibacterota bacterium]